MSRKKNKKISWELTPIRIVYITLIFFIGMCWSFILGLFIGRGYNPPLIDIKHQEKIKKEETKVLPAEELTFLDALRKKRNKEKKVEIQDNKIKSINKKQDKIIYTYQCGSFKNKNDAKKLKSKLDRLIKDYNHKTYLEEVEIKKETWTRVILQLTLTRQENENIQNILQKNNIVFFIRSQSRP